MAPIVRPAREADVAALLRLEALCWRPHLRCDEREVRRRLALFSSGQFVLQGDDGGVLGVLYTQRIVHAGLLLEGSYENQFSLDTPTRRAGKVPRSVTNALQASAVLRSALELQMMSAQ